MQEPTEPDVPDVAQADEPQPPATDTSSSRVRLLLNVLVFQFKLLMDGVRDLLLVPASLVSVLFGIAAGGDQPDRYFKRLLKLGRRSDRFINLFDEYSERGDTSGTADELIEPYKARLMEQASNSPVTARANQVVDSLLENQQGKHTANQAAIREHDEHNRL